MQTRHPLTRHAIRLIVALAIALGLTTVLAGPASAHTSLTGSDPAEAATLTAAPSVVTLTFNQEIGALNPLIVVAGPGDTQYQTGDAIVDRETVSTGLNPLGGAGTYTVAYRVISADGHPVEGQYTFQYAPPPAETSAPTPGSSSAGNATPSNAAQAPATTSSAPGTTANSTGETSTPTTSTSPASNGSATSADTANESAAVNTTSGDGGSTWVYIALAATAALVVAAIAVFIAQRRRSGNRPS